ncbi:MAG TPA: type II secretion system protein [Phycisphaerales bacterium]|nr:type II secretion system protein [Phycisphaerales bacterium]
MLHQLSHNVRRAFTLVEILIVVVILGILAAIVVPQFSTATEDSQRTAVADQVRKVRQALAVYYVRNGNVYPNIVAGDGTWGELIAPGSPYMRQAPANMWVGGVNAKTIVIRNTPDAAFQTTHGWVWDPVTGTLWAGGCNALDEPLPRP